MLKKTSNEKSTSNLTDDEIRRAELGKVIVRRLATYMAIKVGVTVAVAVAAKYVAKKLEESSADSSED